jgi:hypothetical protein
VLSNILRELIIVSEHEDFNVIDMMLSYLITGVANYNKNAAQIVKDAFVDTGEHFSVVLSLFFNTMFLQFDKVIILSLFNQFTTRKILSGDQKYAVPGDLLKSDEFVNMFLISYLI